MPMNARLMRPRNKVAASPMPVGLLDGRIFATSLESAAAVSAYGGGIGSDISFTPGKFGNCATFAGGGNISFVPSQNLVDAMTISMWFRSTSEDDEDFLCSAGRYDGYFFIVRVGSGVKCFAAGTNELFNYQVGVLDGNWHFIAMTRTGSQHKLYVDGTSVSQTGSYPDFGAFNNTYDEENDEYSQNFLSIGGNFDGGYLLLDGDIDQFNMWNRALSPAEIAWIYNGGNGQAAL